ncbi:Spherulin-1A 1 [Diplogelasinospora grovesii]|uniref:Spherulin-1A 1 n=1 Tax=Diplogelasinospora grovesii TaxID=303347 RepID=A0AAN6NH77_9PEZI|nr:Spherulin-1A 1 [Diplogelasinospora grovesii]
MHFTSLLVTASILASSLPFSPVMVNAAPTTAAAATTSPWDTLSLTQQLTLSDLASDRYLLLPNDTDFMFDFNKTQSSSRNAGGSLSLANRKTFPALVGTGSSMAVGVVTACGMNTLHVHPRAAELQIVVQGRLMTETAPENDRRVIINTINPWQMTVFPQGSVHTQFNPDCNDAVFVSAFPSEDPGAGHVLDEVLAFPDDVVVASFGGSIAGADLDRVRKAIPISIAKGVEACLARCNIKRR